MRDFRVKVNQIELQVREYESSGDPIVFLHFGGANLMMWEKALPFFMNRFHLVLLDLRGHGQSEEPETGYDIDTLASDVAGVMQFLQLGKAHIIGSSLGAEVGLGVVANYPEKVLSLVCDGALYNEFGPYSTYEGTLADFSKFVDEQIASIQAAPVTTYPSAEALLEARKKLYQDLGWNDTIEKMEKHGIVKLEEGKFTRAFRKEARMSYFGSYFYDHLENYYQRVQCPVIMIPDADEVKNEKAKGLMTAMIAFAKNGKLVEVEEWNHPYGWVLEPTKICGAILEFLDSQDQK